MQVDFGVDTYVRADHVFERAGVFVERLSVPLAENHSLDDIAEAARVATERRVAHGTAVLKIPPESVRLLDFGVSSAR